jgi:hypothetical protein
MSKIFGHLRFYMLFFTLNTEDGQQALFNPKERKKPRQNLSGRLRRVYEHTDIWD